MGTGTGSVTVSVTGDGCVTVLVWSGGCWDSARLFSFLSRSWETGSSRFVRKGAALD